MTAPGSWLGSALLLVISVAGIYASYLTQGVVNEHLAIKRYGDLWKFDSALEQWAWSGGSQAMAAAIMAMLCPNQASELP